MEYQQERLEWEISWIAAFMEGEGWFSLGKSKTTRRGKQYTSFTVFCGICNTDTLLINECRRIFDKYEIEYCLIKRKGSQVQGYHGLDRYELVIRGIKRVKKVINLVYSYIVGSKKFRLDVILEYIKMRESKKNHNSEYGDEEQAVYEKLLLWKGTRHSKILNDFTPNMQTA